MYIVVKETGVDIDCNCDWFQATGISAASFIKYADGPFVVERVTQINEKEFELRKRTFCWLYRESIAENPKFMNSATVPTLCGVVIGEILESA